MSIRDLFKKAREISLKDAGIITHMEVAVLEAFLMKSPEVIAKERGITVNDVYAVFQRIRRRRRRFQHGVNLFNNLARDKRLYSVLTPKPEPTEEEEEES